MDGKGWFDTTLGALCAQVQALTGQDPHGHTSVPGDGTTHYVFQDEVIVGPTGKGTDDQAVAYVKRLLADAASQWRQAHWPLGREATDTVGMWLANDEPCYNDARYLAVNRGVEGMAECVIGWLKTAPQGSAAWYTMLDLSANDLDRIDWTEVLSVIF